MKSLLLVLLLCPGFLLSQEEALYSVQFSTIVNTSLAVFGGNGKDTSITGSLSGRMRIYYLATENLRESFYVRFDTGLKAIFPLPAKELRIMNENLLQGFQFIRSANGLIDSIFIPATFSDATEHIAIQLLEYFQFYIPVTNEDHWQSRIQANDGLLVAGYSRQSTANGDHYIHLTSLSPVQENSPGLVLSRYNWYDADMKYYFSKNALLPQRVEGNVNRRSGINHKTLLRELNTFQFVLLSVKTNQVNNFKRNSTRLKARPLYYPEKLLERTREKNILKSQSINISSIIQQLQENDQVKNENQQDKLAEDIRACFQAGKDSLSMIKDIFLKADINAFSFKTIRTALITGATSFAQEIIREYLANNAGDWNKLKKIIPSAGLIRDPSYSIQQMLENFAFGKDAPGAISSSSQLALGNMAGSLRFTNTRRADSIASELASFIQPGEDPVLFLSVIGNCGTNNIISFVVPFLSDSSAEIRSYAYYALRFMDSPLVDALFEMGLQKEKEASPLVNIFNALHFRKYNSSLSNSLLNIIASDSSQAIRLGALEVIFEWSNWQPALLASIKNVAADNSNVAIRKKAKEFLDKVDE